LQVFSFPLGTLISGFGIYAFGFDKEVRAQFGAAPTTLMKKPAKKRKR
jgi:hypothetical protein